MDLAASRITLKLQSSGVQIRAGESSAAAVEAIAAHKQRMQTNAAHAAAAASSSSAAAVPSSTVVSPAAASGSHFNVYSRGVLLPLPPTLTALRTAAMDEARGSPYWRALMSSAKAQRQRERADEARRRRAKERAARKKPRTAGAATATNGAHDAEERKTESASTAAAEPDDNDDEEDGGAAAADGNDSESDTASLPAHFPFTFRFFIDGGEVRNPHSYSALVRDRDLIVVELSIQDAARTKRVPLEIYVRDTAAAVAAALAEGSGAVAQPASSYAMSDVAEDASAAAMDGECKAHEVVANPAVRGGTSNAVATPRSRASVSSVHAASMSGVVTAVAGGSGTASTAAALPSSSSSSTADQPHGTHKKPTVVNGAEVLICCSRDCTARASLGPCPHCHKLGHHKAYFCSQECFARNWRKHSAEFHPETA